MHSVLRVERPSRRRLRRLIRSIALDLVLGILSTIVADLMAMLGQEVDRIRQYRPMKKLILDMDPAAPRVSETSGRREGSA